MTYNYCCYRAKYPVKVHVWAGISKRGPTGICIFEGIMDSQLYVDVLRQTLLPFIRTVYLDHHKFMTDNDPKHTFTAAKQFPAANDMNWCKTPAESLDCNPIERIYTRSCQAHNQESTSPRHHTILADSNSG